MNIFIGCTTANNSNVAIVISRFNDFINNNLLNGALDTLKRIGQVKEKNITIVWVPGAYELPLIINILANTKKYDAIIALGTIINGDTNHSIFLAGECISGISKISLKTKIPITFGILTTKNIDQAIERAGTKSGNKGVEAAIAALEMINLLKIIV